jgi:hypothetical protein
MTDLDLAISLFAMEELKERNPSAKRSQTSLPPTASHHGRRRRGGRGLRVTIGLCFRSPWIAKDTKCPFTSHWR